MASDEILLTTCLKWFFACFQAGWSNLNPGPSGVGATTVQEHAMQTAISRLLPHTTQCNLDDIRIVGVTKNARRHYISQMFIRCWR